jgi:hypothetical protein
MTITVEPRCRATDLPADPDTALAVHFGMLLGVSDLELLASNPRGKLRLHNAWLHGEGVVWGYEVTFDKPSRELRVDRGFALDANGRELLLDRMLCLNIDEWLKEHAEELPAGTGEFGLDVVVWHRACLDVPVPAVAGECDDGPETAYSRIRETVSVTLELQPQVRPDTYTRLRAALAHPQGSVQALHDLAALDTVDLGPVDDDPPGTGYFPVPDPTGMVIARITVTRDGAEPDVSVIDHTVRPVHVPTSLVHDALAAKVPPGVAATQQDATTVVMPSAQTLDKNSLGGIAAARWDPGSGWKDTVVSATFDEPNAQLVITFNDAIAQGELVRILIPGAGLHPVVALVDGRPVPLGRDIVLTIEGS